MNVCIPVTILIENHFGSLHKKADQINVDQRGFLKSRLYLHDTPLSRSSSVLRVNFHKTHAHAERLLSYHTRYAMSALPLFVHMRLAHPVVHQRSLIPDYHQWATGGPPDATTSRGPTDVQVACIHRSTNALKLMSHFVAKTQLRYEI